MPYQQLHSIVLLFCSFTFLVSDGFVVKIQPTTSKMKRIPHRLHHRRRFLFLRRAAAKSSQENTSSSHISSNKIQEMASFLSVQLLEKVMMEAMKDDGKSSLDLDAITRLTEALQYQPSTKHVPPTTTATLPSLSSEETTAAEEQAEKVTERSIATKEEDGGESIEIPTTTKNDMISKSQKGLIDTPSEVKATNDQKELLSPLKEKEGPRYGDSISSPIIRSPLEIIASDVPPLRPSSIPNKQSSPASIDEGKEKENESDASEIPNNNNNADNSQQSRELVRDEQVKTTQKTFVDNHNEEADGGGDELGSIAEGQIHLGEASLQEEERTKNSLQYENDERERKLAVGSGNDDKNSHNPSNDIGIDTKDEIVMPATSPPTSSTSTKVESNDVVKDLHSTSTAPLVDNHITEKEITDERKEEIYTIGTDSKSQELLSISATKPSEGEIFQFTTNPSEEELLSSPSSEIVSNQKQDCNNSTSVSSSASSSSAMDSERTLEPIVAKRQPNDPDEEVKLAEMYVRMSIEERAYSILINLGMIEENIDPENPSYDHTNDNDEYCDQTYLSTPK